MLHMYTRSTDACSERHYRCFGYEPHPATVAQRLCIPMVIKKS